ncbi:ATP-binding protein [Planococcus donghaensis]|uniref:histidine kinase n=1 Tax=Planococcus donghaensis TaxID=414778 RepID=A0A1C7EEY8_9BACL|nr:ATP-binding protein [Planococcus donghaensis]ANU22603.1 response regulator receiver protein [Planococcus donghaensis]
MKKLHPKTSMMIQLFCVFWIVFFFLETEKTSSAENTKEIIQLDNNSSKVSLSESVQILKDTEGSYELDELVEPPESWKFVQNEEGVPNGGFSSDIYWIRFTVENTSKNEEWLLELANTFIDKAILYSPEPSGEYSSIQLSNDQSESEGVYSKHPPVFKLVLPNDGRNTFFMRVESQGAMHLPLTIWDHTAYNTKSNQTMALIGLIGGLCLIFCLWCIKWYRSSHQVSFLYLIFLAFSVLVASSSWKGWSFSYIWPDVEWWYGQTLLVTFGVVSLLFVLITKELLTNALELFWLSKVTKVTGAYVLLSWILSYFSYPVANAMLFVLVTLAVLLSLSIALYAWNKRISYVSSYAAALLLSVAILVISFLTAAALIPYVETVQYLLCFSSYIVLLLTAKTLFAKEKVQLEKNEQLEREANERQLIKIEALKSANKRKEELLAYTSNGLRTPLYGMIGLAETIRESANGKITPTMVNQLNDLVANGRNMAHLVNDILDFSKRNQASSRIQVEALVVDKICNDVLALCRPLIQTDLVTLYHTIPSSLPKVVADADHLQQILYNLLDNSIRHTYEGEIVVSAHVLGKELEISVKDTGVGIKEEKIPTLFEWNSTEEKTLENQGMGLKITKNLVELQGGNLKVESQEGTGSQFSFTVPIYEDDGAVQFLNNYESITKEMTAPQLADSILKQHATKRELHVLVIDSEEINRIVLIRQLLSEGYHAIGAENGQTAMHLLSYKPVDLIVMDGRLSDMTGDELCRRIRIEFTLTELPILMLSNVDSLQEKKEAFRAGANDYLLKPCDKEEFLLRVRTLANTSSLTQEITNLNYFLERNVKERTMELEITNLNLLTVNDEIQEIEKSRNEMLSAISHELGTPITLIHSYIQAVKESLIEENNPRYLDMIHKKLLLLERLTEDLVELTEYKSGHMTLRFVEYDMNNWVTRLIESMESDVTQSGRAFKFLGTDNQDDINESLLRIDLDRLDQVISNILWNSVKHTSAEEGMITLAIDILAKNNNNIVLDEECDGELVIRIADNGCGIKKDSLPHIFERFYKINSSANYKGSGLGLAIAKEIILAHNGQIWADSTVGQGSEFIIVLPLTFQ